MLLTFEGVRLVERDAMTALVQRANDAAVIRGRAVPVGGDQAGTEERDLHAMPSFALCEPAARRARHDGQQLVDAMRAGMARQDRAQSVRRQSLRQRAHRAARRCSWRPSRRRRGPPDNPRPGLNRSSRRPRARRPAECRRPAPRTGGWSESGQRLHVGPARHVHGDAIAREHVGHPIIGQPAAVVDARRRPASPAQPRG